MISVGNATETVLVGKKGKILSSIYRVGIKMEYPAQYKCQLHGAGTSRSQTLLNIVLEQLAERDWYTKSQSSL